MRGWVVETRRGPPDALLAAPPPQPPVRLLRWCVPTATALVLGSSQRSHSGLHRRSGGTAVLVTPGRLVWADVIVPRADPLHVEDVSQASLWLGTIWARALADLGVDAEVYAGPIVKPDGVCFAGISPGEVVIGGAKVVGIAQRRTRTVSLFQCAAMRHSLPEETRAVGLGDMVGIESAFERRLELT